MTTIDPADIHISAHMRNLLLTQYTPEQLRMAASSIEDQAPDARRRRRWRQMLDDASFEELADMLIAGKLPTVGWWQRHRRRVPADA